MRHLVACVLLLAACEDSGGHRQPPPGGSGGAIGSGGSGGSGGIDGGETDAASTFVDGTVGCYGHVGRTPCTGTSFAGASVEIFGGATATVDATTGAFELDATGLVSAQIRYTGNSSTEPAIVIAPVPGTAVTLPTISNQLLLSFYTTSQFPQQYNGDGWVMAFAVDGNDMPQPNFKVQNAPVNQSIWYDDPQGGDVIARAGTQIQTGPAGLAVFPNIAPGNLQFEFAAANGSGTPLAVSVDVVANHLTIVLVRVL